MSSALSCHFFQSICYAIVFRNKHESKLIIFYVISNTICLNFFLGQTFRHTLYPSYKSNRGPTPDTIVQGLQYLKASIKAMSIKVIEVKGLPLLQMVRWVGCLQVKTGLGLFEKLFVHLCNIFNKWFMCLQNNTIATLI